MKNNLLKIFFLYLFLIGNSSAEQFTFQTKNIELVDEGNLIIANEGKAFSSNGSLEIEAKKFEYRKNLNTLKAFSGVAYLKDDNLKIEFDEINSNGLTLITIAKDNVKIIDLNGKVTIETNLISFDKKNRILESKEKSIIKDKNNNILTGSFFSYNLKNGIIKIKDVNLKDINDNNFNISLAFIDTLSYKLIGNDIEINLSNKSFDKNNEPRIKGTSIIYTEKFSEITKGVFTTCKKTDKCPPWQLSAEKIQHNPETQTINYKNAFLKVYDIPVMYFPKFFHPDPTVKRKSGFLVPTIKNSPNSGNFLSLPYFSAISQNKDMTFTPRFYSSDKLLLQTEFRQKNKNSEHITDVSILTEKNESSKTHFFYKFNKSFEFEYFAESDLSLTIEKTSNDTYLRGNKLISPLIKSYNVLENKISMNFFSDNLSIKSEIKSYENLDVKDTHDRYEFILPKIDIIKRFENKTNLDGNFLLKSKNFIRNYSTNIFEKVNINNFIFNSNPKITNSGFYNNYDFIIKNVNSDTQNSSGYQEDENFYLSGIFQFNSSYPLIKERNEFLNILKPKMALKISPNHTKDQSKSSGNRIDVSNIYSINRLSTDDSVEGGASLTLGNDFTIFNKDKSKDILAIKFANNIRLEENDDLPRNNQLNSKNSNFFGEISFSPNEMISTKYNASAKNNLTDINYENFIAEFKINNFVTTFDYLNENNSLDKISYLTNTSKYNFNEMNSIKYSTRENKSSSLTEYYNLIYEYKNDCLAASIEYNKDYYNDRDIKPEENIFLKLTIIPFGETSSPNLKD